MSGMSDQQFDNLVDKCLASLDRWRQSLIREPYIITDEPYAGSDDTTAPPAHIFGD